MHGTKQVEIWSDMNVLMTNTAPPGLTPPLDGSVIDLRLGAVNIRTPAASGEDFHSQAILKFNCPSSLEYKARQGTLG